MTTDDFLTKYEAALLAQSQAEITVKVLEMQAKLMVNRSPVNKKPSKPERKSLPTRQEKFLEKHKGRLSIDDVELIEQVECSPKQAFSFLSTIGKDNDERRISERTILRYLGTQLKHGKSSNQAGKGKKTIDSISLVMWAHNWNGETEKD